MLIIAVLNIGHIFKIRYILGISHQSTEDTEQKHEDEKVERDPVDLPIQTTQLVPIPVLIQHQLRFLATIHRHSYSPISI